MNPRESIAVATLTLAVSAAACATPGRGAPAVAGSAAAGPAAAETAAPVKGAAVPAAAGGNAASDDGWRSARWGMSVEEVLKAFPGEAKRLDPEEKLADGNVVAVGIDGYTLQSRQFRVRFLFEKGRLALVSLRTPQEKYADASAYEQLQKYLGQELGGPGEASKDDNFVDLRQTRWKGPGTTVDLKFIPGVVVIQYYPTRAAAT